MRIFKIIFAALLAASLATSAVGQSRPTVNAKDVNATGTVTTPNLTVTGTVIGTVSGPFKEIVNLEQYGGGAGVDNTTPFNNASTACAAKYGCTIVLKAGVRYPVNGAVALGKNVGILGSAGIADPGNPFGVTTQYFNYLQNVGALILGASGTIDLANGGGIENTYIIRSNMVLDGTDLPTNYSGTCVTAGTVSQNVNSVYLKSNALLGCGQAFRGQNIARGRFENNLIDANNGFWTTTSGDFNRYIGNHLYGVLQASATGHDTFSLRSGTAFKFDGSFLGGPYLINNFSYGYNIGVDILAAGQVVVSDHWVDGPTAVTTNRPLDVNSVGIRTSATNYIEAQYRGIKISCQGTAFSIGANTIGITPISDVILWQNNVGFNVSGYNLVLTNFSMRAYDTGFNFNSKAAGNSARLIGGIMFDRNAPGSGLTGIADPIDVQGGTGSPILTNVSRVDGNLDIRNELRPDVTASSGVITVPLGQPAVRVTGAPTITNILPASDNATVTLEASGAGMIVSGANFLLASAFTSTQVGATITVKYSRWINKWVEQSRGPL